MLWTVVVWLFWLGVGLGFLFSCVVTVGGLQDRTEPLRANSPCAKSGRPWLTLIALRLSWPGILM